MASTAMKMARVQEDCNRRALEVFWEEAAEQLLTPKIAPSFWLGFTVDSMAIDGFLNSLLSLLVAKF
jgi:hypothetical protein